MIEDEMAQAAVEQSPENTAGLHRELQAETLREPAAEEMNESDDEAAASSNTVLITQRGKPGPRLSPAERDLLLKLLVAGEREGAIFAVFRASGYVPPSSSTLNYYREAYREVIEAARTRRTEAALSEGLALKAERVKALKDHADVLNELRFVPDKNGRLWNERAWRQTVADIAAEMGERRPTEGEQSGEIVKVIVGIDPDKV